AAGQVNWGSADAVTNGTCAGTISGSQIGTKISCTITGLNPSTSYEFQLVSFRGTPNVDAVFGGLSNIVDVTTSAPAAPIVLTPPSITSVVTSADGAFVSWSGVADTLTFFYDNYSENVVTKLNASDVSYIHKFSWPMGSTFVCYKVYYN